jgi:hypothetical protein
VQRFHLKNSPYQSSWRIVFGLEVLSLTKSRLFHLAMVLVLTPKQCAKVVFEALAALF